MNQQPTEKLLPSTGKGNWVTIVIHIIDRFYNLATSGQLAGLIIFGIVVIFGFIIHKLPPNCIDARLEQFIDIFNDAKFGYFVLIVTIIGLLYALHSQAQRYKAEINRLVETRKVLMHGKKNGVFIAELKYHNSSKFNIDKEAEDALV